MKRRQQGVILILLGVLLFFAGAGFLFSVANSNQTAVRRDREIRSALVDAREALLAYAVTVGDAYGATGAGPGHLPCPDTNGDGVENAPCAGNVVGRLPRSIVLPSGVVLLLSDYGVGFDERIWYAVSPPYKRLPQGSVNSSAPGTFTVDGQPGVAAILLASGPALSGQTRASNTASNYLEGANTTVPDFVSFEAALAPNGFNDRVLPLYGRDILAPVTARVVEPIRTALDTYHTSNGFYPPDAPTFAATLAVAGVMPAWYAANGWPATVTYSRPAASTAVLQFTGCAIVYTVNFGVVPLSRSQSSC